MTARDSVRPLLRTRQIREFTDEPVSDEMLAALADVGRWSGSSSNNQPWRFVVVESPDAKQRVAETVYVPGTVAAAPFVVALVSSGGLDAGRCAENMMLAAWNDGVASCPNGFPDVDAAAAVLGLEGEDRPATVLTFGYPAKERDPQSRPPEERSARANRKPLDELVQRI